MLNVKLMLVIHAYQDTLLVLLKLQQCAVSEMFVNDIFFNFFILSDLKDTSHVELIHFRFFTIALNPFTQIIDLITMVCKLGSTYYQY